MGTKSFHEIIETVYTKVLVTYLWVILCQNNFPSVGIAHIQLLIRVPLSGTDIGKFSFPHYKIVHAGNMRN